MKPLRFTLFGTLVLLLACRCGNTYSDSDIFHLSPVKLFAKWDTSFVAQPIHSVRIQSKSLLRSEQKRHNVIAADFKKNFLKRGIQVQDETLPTDSLAKVDAVLVLGKSLQDTRPTYPVPTPIGLALITTARTHRMVVQLLRASDRREIWTGEVGFTMQNYKVIGKAVVKQLAKVGLLATTSQTD